MCTLYSVHKNICTLKTETYEQFDVSFAQYKDFSICYLFRFVDAINTSKL